jgi:hypothetical protein
VRHLKASLQNRSSEYTTDLLLKGCKPVMNYEILKRKQNAYVQECFFIQSKKENSKPNTPLMSDLEPKKNKQAFSRGLKKTN